MVLVPGQNMWKTLRGGLFGIFGVTTYLVGPFLLYLAYLLASGYRVTLFAGKVALMSVLCAGVPVICSASARSCVISNTCIPACVSRSRSSSLLGLTAIPCPALRCR